MRIVRAIPVLLAAVLAASPARTEGPEPADFVSPLTGRSFRAVVDPASGDKRLVDGDGRAWRSAAEIAGAERALAGDGQDRMDAALRRLAAAPSTRDDPVVVGLLLSGQPLHDAAAALAPALRVDLARLGAGDGDPESARRAALERLRAYRREAFALAAPRARDEQDRLLARFSDLPVLGHATALNLVWVEVAPGRLPAILAAAPELRRVLSHPRVESGLNTSVGSVGASAFWTGGYSGAGAAVAVLDTGADSSHPALSGAFAAEGVFLEYASAYDASFGDDETSTDDLHSHGTHCCGIVGARTTIDGGTTYEGVARATNLVNVKWMFRRTDGKGSGWGQDCFLGVEWARDLSDVFSGSFGGTPEPDYADDALALLFDAVVQALRIDSALAAGNNGPSAGTLLSPGNGYNVVTVGATYDNGTTSPSDDSLASYSSRGPTADGRRKPDLTAPGSSISSCYSAWEGGNPDFVSFSGTSMATPHVAGALGLLVDLDPTASPMARKALLVNSTRVAAPYASSPDNAVGYGGMDLAAAYAARGDVHEGSFGASGSRSRYYRRTAALAAGDRATLVWLRHVAYSDSDWPAAPPDLLDLDLYLYDGDTGAAALSSTSVVEPVEHLRATGPVASPVLRVHRAGAFPAAFTEDEFALAAPVGFTAVTAPALEVSFASLPASVAGGEEFAVEVTLANTGGLPAIAPEVGLTLPAGFSLVSGDNPAVLDAVAPGGTGSAEWVIRGPDVTGEGEFAADAETASFGETVVAAGASGTVLVDATPPAGTLSVDGGAAWAPDRDVALSLLAADEHTSVADMRFSENGTDFGAWQEYAGTAAYTLSAGDGARTVYAQFRDAHGNVSETASDSIGLDTAAPAGTLAIDDGAAWTNGAQVDLSLAASDAASGVAEMRFAQDGGPYGPWEPYATTRALTLAGPDGTRAVSVVFRDAAGHESAPAGDTIGLDRAPPSVSVSAAAGVSYTRSRVVTLTLFALDPLSGVADMRFSLDGTVFGAWEAYAPSRGIDLGPVEGGKRVWVEYRDRAGNQALASDTIVLDLTPPAGGIALADPRVARNDRVVPVLLAAADALSGVAEMRLRAENGPAGTWTDFSPAADFTLPDADGAHSILFAVRDAVGNESPEYPVAVLLDRVPPVCSFVPQDGRPCVLPEEPLTFAVTAYDDRSGLADARVSLDGGVTYAAPVPVAEDDRLVVPRDGVAGLVTGALRVRDAAGNESAEATAPLYLVETAPPPVAARCAGALEAAGDVDALSVDLAAGDLLSARLVAADRAAGLALDLSGPGGERLVEGRYPAGDARVEVRAFPAPATGRYLLLVRRDDGVPAAAGAWTLAVKVRRAKPAPAAGVPAAAHPFAAVAGTAILARLAGTGVGPASVTLVGPAGPVAAPVTGRPGSVTVGPAVLPFTGAYEIRVAAAGAVLRLSARPPRLPRGPASPTPD